MKSTDIRRSQLNNTLLIPNEFPFNNGTRIASVDCPISGVRPLSAIFLLTRRFHSPWILEFGKDNGFRESVRDEAPTSNLHYLYFFSDILVVSYVLSCVPRTYPNYPPLRLNRWSR